MKQWKWNGGKEKKLPELEKYNKISMSSPIFSQ